MDKAKPKHPIANKDFTQFPPWTIKPIAGISGSSSSAQVHVPTRGELYCLDHFLSTRVPQWHHSEVSRQIHLCGAAVDKLHRERGRAAMAKNKAKLPAVRTQPRRAVRQKRGLEELLAEKGRRPNKKLLEGDYVLPRVEVAEAVYTTKYHVEGVKDGGREDGFQLATLAFVKRLEGVIGEKQKELVESVSDGTPRSCALVRLEAQCPCCRTCSTTVSLPPIQPDALMMPTPSLGNWPAYLGQSSPRARKLSRMLLSSIVEEIHVGPTAKKIEQEEHERKEEDVEAAIVSVGGLRFAVDFCAGDRVIML